MRVGVLTGGGDCPGLNAVIRGIVRRGVTDYGFSFVGFRDGWKGPLDGITMEPKPTGDIRGAKVLAVLGDSITTDHISPAGNIRKSAPAGEYLGERHFHKN